MSPFDELDASQCITASTSAKGFTHIRNVKAFSVTSVLNLNNWTTTVTEDPSECTYCVFVWGLSVFLLSDFTLYYSSLLPGFITM